MLEKDLTLDIAQRLRTLLAQQSIEVLLTRDKDEKSPQAARALRQRAEGGPLPLDPPQLAREPALRAGVETFYLGPTEDPYLTRLAGLREPGVGLLAGRRAGPARPHLPRCLPAGVAQARRDRPALPLPIAGQGEPGARDRGVKTAPFIVLLDHRHARHPGRGLLPVERGGGRGCSPSRYRQHIAEALAHGIGAYAKTPPPEPPERPRRKKGIAMSEQERDPPRRDRSGHLEELDLGLERPAPRGRELRRLAARHGGRGCSRSPS